MEKHSYHHDAASNAAKDVGRSAALRFRAYRRFGYKAFVLMFSRRGVKVFGIMFLSLIAYWVSLGQDGIAADVLYGVASIGFTIFYVLFFLSVFVTWLQYRSYQMMLDSHALKVRRGVFNREEFAIPYRQIQDVNISYSLIDALFGIRRLVLVSAHPAFHAERGDSHRHSPTSILPAMDHKQAEEIREELLREANIQKVSGHEEIR